jgi:transposase
MITATEHARRVKKRMKRGHRTTRRAQRRARRKAHPRLRRKKGDKSKNAKVGFVAVIYTLKTTRAGLEGPINKQIIATFESHRALMVWASREAAKRGYGNKRTLFLADGSEHIWRLKDELFPEAEGCLDWYHVVEKLWEAGAMLHREGSDELASMGCRIHGAASSRQSPSADR